MSYLSSNLYEQQTVFKNFKSFLFSGNEHVHLFKFFEIFLFTMFILFMVVCSPFSLTHNNFNNFTLFPFSSFLVSNFVFSFPSPPFILLLLCHLLILFSSFAFILFQFRLHHSSLNLLHSICVLVSSLQHDCFHYFLSFPHYCVLIF